MPPNRRCSRTITSFNKATTTRARRATSPSVGNSHDAAVSVQVSDGSFNGHPVNQQPSGVHVRGNRIHARNGRHGIKAEGTGAFAVHGGGQLAPEAATATAIVDAAAVVFGMS